MDESSTERDASAPEPQPTPEGSAERISLPMLISNEFGISASQARQEIALGRVEVDGQNLSVADQMNPIKSQIAGKEVHVIGSTRHFKFTYSAE